MDQITERELILIDKYSSLRIAVCNILAKVANELDEELFLDKIWPAVKTRISTSLEILKPEWLLFIVVAGKKFPVRDVEEFCCLYIIYNKNLFSVFSFRAIIYLIAEVFHCKD